MRAGVIEGTCAEGRRAGCVVRMRTCNIVTPARLCQLSVSSSGRHRYSELFAHVRSATGNKHGCCARPIWRGRCEFRILAFFRGTALLLFFRLLCCSLRRPLLCQPLVFAVHTHRLTRQDVGQSTSMAKTTAAFDVPLTHGFWLPFAGQRMCKRTCIARGASIISKEFAWHLSQGFLFFRGQLGVRQCAACIRRHRMTVFIALLSYPCAVFTASAPPTASTAV